MYTVLLVVHTIIVLFLIGVILLQRSESDGFGIGGGGPANFLAGKGAVNAITRTTAVLAALFMGMSLLLAVMVSRGGEQSIVDQVDTPLEQSAPASEEKPEEPVKETAPSVPRPE